MPERVTIENLKEWFPETDFSSVTKESLSELNEWLDEARMQAFVSWGFQNDLEFPGRW